MNPYIKEAGPYPVSYHHCPFYLGPVDLKAPRAGVLHTTEGSTEEGAESIFIRHFAPHFCLGKSASGKIVINQLVPLGQAGAALEAHNQQAIVQIEMVGFSKDALWLPDSGTLDALAHLMVVLEQECGIPLSHPWPDDDWGRAGYETPHRHSGKFGKVAGWFGHQDVPNNCHWDCGGIQWSKIFAYAEKLKAVPEDFMLGVA